MEFFSSDQAIAKKLVLSRGCALIDNVFYFKEPIFPKQWYVAVPQEYLNISLRKCTEFTLLDICQRIKYPTSSIDICGRRG